MKRDRQAEGKELLQGAERNLRESLIEILPEVVASGEAIFFNSQFNPHGLAPVIAANWRLLSPDDDNSRQFA